MQSKKSFISKRSFKKKIKGTVRYQTKQSFSLSHLCFFFSAAAALHIFWLKNNQDWNTRPHTHTHSHTNTLDSTHAHTLSLSRSVSFLHLLFNSFTHSYALCQGGTLFLHTPMLLSLSLKSLPKLQPCFTSLGLKQVPFSLNLSLSLPIPLLRSLATRMNFCSHDA